MGNRLDLAAPAVLCLVLYLGLSPFHAPRNDVGWLGGGNGLRFGENGTAFARRRLETQEFAPWTIELRVKPQSISRAGAILSVYDSGLRSEFLIRQSLGDLEIDDAPDERRSRATRFYVPDVFSQSRPAFVAIAAGAGGTSIYLDGLLAARSSFRIANRGLTGTLILGDAARQPDTWSGDLLGLAIYGAELSGRDVLQHYETWTNERRPDILPRDHLIAGYWLDERSGPIAHDSASQIDLQIPERYTVVDKALLEPFWREFSLSRSFWTSVIKNVAGFLPLGFCFYGLFLSRGLRRSQLLAVGIGATVSLAIETLQFLLPTRDSGTTDILTNTLGTYCGTLLYRSFAYVVSADSSPALLKSAAAVRSSAARLTR